MVTCTYIGELFAGLFFTISIPNIPLLIISAGIAFVGSILGAVIGSYLQMRYQDQQRKVAEIYRPLMEELEDAQNGYFAEDGREFHSSWDDFDAYLKFRTDDEIQRQMENYVSSLASLSRLNIELREKTTSDPPPKFGKEFAEVLHKDMVKETNAEYQLVVDGQERYGMDNRHRIPFDVFFKQYGHIFVNHVDGSDEDLSSELIEFAEEYYENEVKFLSIWNEDFPEWEQKILNETQNLSSDNHFRVFIKKKAEIQREAVDLMDSVSQEVNKII
jgi:hypothetical protein